MAAPWVVIFSRAGSAAVEVHVEPAESHQWHVVDRLPVLTAAHVTTTGLHYDIGQEHLMTKTQQ